MQAELHIFWIEYDSITDYEPSFGLIIIPPNIDISLIHTNSSRVICNYIEEQYFFNLYKYFSRNLKEFYAQKKNQTLEERNCKSNSISSELSMTQ